LHERFRQLLAQRHHRGRIAAEEPVGEGVDLVEFEFHVG
jgi:hypothetical protein